MNQKVYIRYYTKRHMTSDVDNNLLMMPHVAKRIKYLPKFVGY